MYLNTAVLIPQTKGITFRTKGESTYVQYEIGRTYDPEKQYNSARRVEIGIQLPDRPEMMLPNENYLEYFLPEGEGANPERQEMAEKYEAERQRRFMLRDHFLALFYEFQNLSRKDPNGIVNADKVQRLNAVLRPLIELTKDEPSAIFLAEIPEPEVTGEKDGEERIRGKSYSDIALLMAQFKSTVTRYFQKRF